jgi:CheY-like chemotaxis protein
MIQRFTVVDDDPDDLGLFREALSEVGDTFICDSAKDGKDLLGKLESGQIKNPDVIFLDVNMPVMNGWECLENLKNDSRYKTIPVIMYSTSSAKRDSDKALQLGAIAFLEKPNNFFRLRDLLKDLAASDTISKESIEHAIKDRKS